MNVSIPVGLGELYDKISILEIKSGKIKDPAKLAHVRKELELLKKVAAPFPVDAALYAELTRMNARLWDVEDALRLKESREEFDHDFVRLARGVYATNDRRAEIKRLINVASGSEIVEVKSYEGSG